MTYRRSITARAKLFYQQQNRVAPSFSHTHRDDSDREDARVNPIYRSPETSNYIQNRFFGNRSSFSSFQGSRNAFGDRRFAVPAACGLGLGRNFSSGSVGEGAADKIEILNDMVGVLGEKAVEAAPVMNEVAIAAADSFFPVAALQYFIEYVHIYTGLDWWASIALTTFLIRTLQFPLLVNQLKSTTKFTLLRPKLEAIKEEMNEQDMSPAAVTDGQKRMKQLFREYGVTPFTPLRGLFISAPIFASFFFAVNNMAEKVPSFKDGGIFWFTDLTTPDAMYIFPVLTALTFWITVECNAQEGLEGNPTAGTIKTVSRVFAALTIPLTASFPKAIFCYWISSNLFSLGYGLVIKKPEVKKMLGIPIIPVSPPSPSSSTNKKPALSFFDSLKKYAAAQQHQSLSSSSPPPPPSSPSVEASSKPTISKIAPPSSALSQRIKSLEKEVKGRKKGKRR
ncbi:hypothetical protein CASFOL_020240 [Castilleja foliolosa]|uniref:Membrane insertase YidC/Oxa/ALB C-terminal domain-containing protein n=1 Tax=Castilleja foliolosa TaxID=1961234 RepID=A0ABD3D0B0_9LAMI